MRPIVLIPAYKPTIMLCSIVQQLIFLGISKIVIVDDGSGKDCDTIFSELDKQIEAEVIRHAVNRGKGAALRTGFRYIMDRYPQALGVITADADGQHLPKDIYNIKLSLIAHPHSLILGSRCFDKNIPFRSMVGNTCTRLIIQRFFKLPITDTQTGLYTC